VIDVGDQFEIRSIRTETKGDMIKDGYLGHQVGKVYIVGGYRTIGYCRDLEATMQKFQSMIDAVFLSRFAAFQSHGRTVVAEGSRKYALGSDEIDHQTTEQAGQLKMPILETVYADVMGIQSGIVVDINAGKDIAAYHFIDHTYRKSRFIRFT
jgi:hypothetical protein